MGTQAARAASLGKARMGTATAVVEVCDVHQPASITDLLRVLFPQGGVTPDVFDRIHDAWKLWHEANESSSASEMVRK